MAVPLVVFGCGFGRRSIHPTRVSRVSGNPIVGRILGAEDRSIVDPPWLGGRGALLRRRQAARHMPWRIPNPLPKPTGQALDVCEKAS